MRKGLLQQLGAPQLLYDQPTNLFVATFIGSPAMNLFDARIHEGGNGKIVCEIARQALALPETVLSSFSSLRDRCGGNVVLGVRPEHLVDPLRRSPDLPRLRGRAVVIEALG
ncbi:MULTISPECIES: hypothetical protein [Rhizobium/Agrobacterium group]|uniref:hypothetical protein n=1 Tax=Rhizobium/Agrobacterium group TaxID=227290 RepID=UPI001ADD4F5D|nr:MULTISPECIES: hypothetical protein [Rhizobium/Agrobacterium group]MBO9112564.1 hypothetical protein [Agrobacterium sp. S2/73]QXZ76069.1 hypothetical protein J5276_28840 [Agrobacterium sp. S7/73]QYA16923.1 hypothetical protein J5284_32670 [Rhizobium sp. AB2/73]UEQ85504.1 hypothetical protein I8E17_31390 [Rhizobium sp. AB2/73]